MKNPIETSIRLEIYPGSTICFMGAVPGVSSALKKVKKALAILIRIVHGHRKQRPGWQEFYWQ